VRCTTVSLICLRFIESRDITNRTSYN
jgi:hypothetical protein